MTELFTLVVGLIVVMAAIPLLTILILALAILKRFVVRWHDPVERLRYRVRLGGNVAYFVALLNAATVLYFFLAAGLPVGPRFEPWLLAAAERFPEGWYLATTIAFAFGGLILKLTRSPYAALFLLGLFLTQTAMELAPSLFQLMNDPGLFARFFVEILRLQEVYGLTTGIAGSIMRVVIAALIYGVLIQAAYYGLICLALLIALQGSLALRRQNRRVFLR